MDTVSESLGLTADDLGMDRVNDFEGLDFGEDPGDELDQDDENLDDSDNLGDDNEDTNLDPEPRQRQQQERQPKQQQRQPDDLSVQLNQQRGEFDVKQIKYDAKGNILSSDGKRIVAKAGKEARMFTTLHQRTEQLGTIRQAAQHAIDEVDNRLKQAVEIGTTLHRQLTQLQQNGNAYQQAGLTDSENREAVELASIFKKSPVEAIKTMLTRAAARGIDMTTLGLQPGGFDPAALMHMVQQRIDAGLQPIKQFNDQTTQQAQQQNNNTEVVENARRELSQFLIANPDAKEHLVTIQKIYNNPQFVNMPLNEVWLRLKLNLAQRQRNGGHPSGRLRNRQQPRLPNGRSNPGGGGNGGGQRPTPNEPAPVSESYEDIVRSVMNSQG